MADVVNRTAAQGYATQEYNLLVADMFDELTEEVAASEAGQAVIRYFLARIKRHFEDDFCKAHQQSQPTNSSEP